MTDEAVKPLPQSARKALHYIVDRLRDGFTGQLTLHCRDGGVGDLEETTRRRVMTKDLTDEAPLR